MSNIRNIRRQVADLRAKVNSSRVVLSMPDGSKVSFLDRGDAAPRLIMRAFARLGDKLNGGESPPESRLDEALALVVGAVEVRSSVPGLQAVTRDLVRMASDSQPEGSGAPGA